MSSKNSRPLHEIVAENIIKKLEAGTAPWQKPWNDNGPAFELPYNATTGNRYKGINIFSLMMADREDPRWMTFKQASEKGWQVRKGEKASLIQYVKLHQLLPKKDERGKPILDEKGKPVKVQVRLDRPIITTAWVFNAEQINGIEPLIKPDVKQFQWDAIERAENLIQASGADISNKAGDRAFYSPLRDSITMPLREQFDAPDKYYATVLHELGHWTGHENRLDRSLINRFGTEGYAREELRAEIASMLIGQELHIGHDPGQHVAYVDSWIQTLRDTPYEIHAAAVDAEKIFNYLLAFEQKREIKAAAEVAVEEHTVAQPQKAKEATLSMGDEIAYNNTVYRMQGQLKRGRMRVEDLTTGNVFSLSKTDRLYGSLLQAKQHPETVKVSEDLNRPVHTEKEAVAAYGIRR
ncbi:zincin-like metallopeptidase domain-containing protein [Sphingobacterium daejeonense]|uniref:ArdC family protein n=1 Tax=Sphingobacterium daejeonense TaxID=371142 RepID=UPI0021A959CC|nr:zincin-like metallopeptidase domain-containing protein [Sphingobacterium daejeonense]MCT1530207.1 zincin-like metallopeptidase domain-containing protein [Sphingobacterium daejeonense]